MNKKIMIIVTSIILIIVGISVSMLKLYNMYALSSYVDSTSGDPASDSIGENERKYVKLRIANTANTTQPF